MRAGEYGLSLLASPLNVQVIQALAEKPRSLVELRRPAGSPPQTTMRSHLRTLTAIGVLERRRQMEFPGAVEYELAAAGRDLLALCDVLGGWLLRSPEGEIQPGTTAAKSSIKALAEGWSSTIVRALAARPLSLTELNRLILALNYPSLERRLGAMRLAGLIEATPGAGRSTPYMVSEWLRRAAAPITAAMGWERRHLPGETTAISTLDAEALFLLAVPLVTVSADLSGRCRLAVEVANGVGDRRLAGAMIEVREGKMIACSSRLEGEAGAWAVGSTRAWIGALTELDTAGLEVGGDCGLVTALFDGLHGALFGARQPH